MPTLGRSNECRKFAPNIFNKTKCTNCFKQKEEHSAEALECNRACRKVAKCGYLFVAPGWDFTNPINRTKRWQRRWFVLYDDGELSYSLDEHPETVPQACVDMNKVSDVSDAEELTGNPYSLAITTHDDVHFVKATCREEAKWWMDVLSVFPRSKGRQKRNAMTFSAVKNVSNGASLPATPRPYAGADMSPTVAPRTEDKMRINRRCQIRENGTVMKNGYTDDLKIKVTAAAAAAAASSNWREKSDMQQAKILLDEYEDCKMNNNKDVTDSPSRPHSRRSTSSISSSNLDAADLNSHRLVRGDPDGCGLDLSTLRYSPSAELRIDSISEDLLNIKKGWLMKQGNHPDQPPDWNKYWFVLRGSALLYYRDPTAEDQGILDGVIDLSVMKSISEAQASRNYGFQITTWDEKRFFLSAVTAGIRTNWINAIKKASGHSDNTKLDKEKDLPSPSTPRSLLLSSDEEYRTASENGRQSSSDWGETLPPSPPLNRTPISRVKERARGVTRTRLYNSRISKSSPPSSRRSTLDSASHAEILSVEQQEKEAAQMQQQQQQRSSLAKKLEKQAIELEEVKRQLTAALRQLSSAEEELLRLRQRQQDYGALEKQMQEMARKLRQAEAALDRKDVAAKEELEAAKKAFAQEKAGWKSAGRERECELRESERRCSQLCGELAASCECVERLRAEFDDVSRRLARGIEENEALYKKLRELENCKESSSSTASLNSIRRKGRSLDSLSDLTNIDYDLDCASLDKVRLAEEYENLRGRFEKAILEIRAMRRELKESHVRSDCLEIALINARQNLKSVAGCYESQASLMAARVKDLTEKLTTAEKQVRALKAKLSKSETREKRRSLSLKGKESLSVCKELEEKLTLLEGKIAALLDEDNECKAKSAEKEEKRGKEDKVGKECSPLKLNGRIRRKSLDSAIGEPMKVLIRLNTLEAKVAEASKKRRSKSADSLEPSPEEVAEMDALEKATTLEIVNIERILRKKVGEIYVKRKALEDSGAFTDEAKLNLMAEKLAYESVLMCRLRELCRGYRTGDVEETERLMADLEDKLENGCKDGKGLAKCTNKSDDFDDETNYFASSLARYLIRCGKSAEKYGMDRRCNSVLMEPSDFSQRSKVWDRPNPPKESLIVKSLKRKAASLASKADKFADTKTEEFIHMDEGLFQERLWRLSREAADDCLVKAEVDRVMTNWTFASNDESEVSTNGGDEVTVERLLNSRANLEKWGNEVAGVLAERVAQAAQMLKKKRDKMDARQKRKLGKDDAEAGLKEFAEIVARRSLLEARLSAMVEGDRASPSDTTTTMDEATLSAEVQFLYAKLRCDLRYDEGKKVFDSLDTVGSEVLALRNSLEDLVRKRGSVASCDSIWGSCEGIREDMMNAGIERCGNSSPSSGTSWLEGVCRRCSEIKEQIVNLQACLSQSQECQKCGYLQEQLKSRDSGYEDLKKQLEDRHRLEMDAVRANFENDKKSVMKKHEQETAFLKEKCKKLERRLDTLDAEYAQQMEELRSSQFMQHSSVEYDTDSLSLRYQTEIEQLRALCEKGLAAMESSHKRTLADLKERHKEEMEALKLEKDQALAEETQATLAALDAMRKAHEAEVQKEIAKFKKDYSKKLEWNGGKNGEAYKEHEADIEGIKMEILSLSEKYSVKCVESAALQEELREAHSQLMHAQNKITQLSNRNKQLRAHLTSDLDSLDESQTSMQLDERTNQICDLKAQFLAHDDALNTLCTHLSNGQCDEASLHSLLDNLQRIRHDLLGSNSRKNLIFKKSKTSEVDSYEMKKNSKISTLRTSCSTSIKGMVAERKKIFEH